MKSVNPTAQARRRYLVRFATIAVAYVVVLFASLTLAKHVAAHSALWYVLLLAPIVPVAFMVPVMVTYLRETDEFQRRLLTESLAIAAGITAMLSVTYGFLEIAGFPQPSAWYVWIVLMGSWLIAQFFVARHYGSDSGC